MISENLGNRNKRTRRTQDTESVEQGFKEIQTISPSFSVISKAARMSNLGEKVLRWACNLREKKIIELLEGIKRELTQARKYLETILGEQLDIDLQFF